MTGKVICFDLEGPLSPQDNAYEVMGLIEKGHKIFEVISKYDDILALERREGYEPGDTLSLIIPFLIHHDISEEDILNVSRKAKIVDGAGYLISRLKQLGWSPYNKLSATCI
jgi:energy-converting hydrogenase A subunit R